ncbi:hypothetical protein X735_31410 [Mesorhizobium sp. L2C085B000]|uniref:hypothetical protein n=1 Tax=Mesorhizobium sp. L2C085B000 TaxID=1287117 RepID=UPI0003D0264B|nr:hypothetical protein [Mesorhizobium sp. L2C085B000]ESZ06329.1 hypothetical protein X735_31410 [Mesorhizobium sp. L2C085B000]
MDGTNGTKKEKQNVKSASDSVYGHGVLGETALTNSSPPLSTLAQESLAGGGSNAHRADFVLTSTVQDNVPHLAARCA